MNLRIPGPVPLPLQVLNALSRPMINHRGPVFRAIQAKVLAGLAAILQTESDILIFPASGTGGLEAAIANTLSPGDSVLSCSAGSFGVRFAAIAKAYGAQVTTLQVPDGSAVEPGQLAAALRDLPAARAVLLTHSETSTGVLNPLEALARAVRENSDALMLVDAVSSLGAAEVDMDGWGLDVVVTGSQKALMGPPGAAIVGIGPRAWRAYEQARMPRFYWDWQIWRRSMQTGETPVTPPLPVYYALDIALDMIHEEGLPNVYARHLHLSEYTRDRGRRMGFQLFADSRYASPTVTALCVSPNVDAGDLIRQARSDFQVEFAGGFGDLKSKLIRIGHLGYVYLPDMQEAMDALEKVTQRALTVPA